MFRDRSNLSKDVRTLTCGVTSLKRLALKFMSLMELSDPSSLCTGCKAHVRCQPVWRFSIESYWKLCEHIVRAVQLLQVAEPEHHSRPVDCPQAIMRQVLHAASAGNKDALRQTWPRTRITRRPKFLCASSPVYIVGGICLSCMTEEPSGLR